MKEFKFSIQVKTIDFKGHVFAENEINAKDLV